MYSFAFTSLLGPCYHPVLSTQNSLTMAPRPACGLWIDASDYAYAYIRLARARKISAAHAC